MGFFTGRQPRVPAADPQEAGLGQTEYALLQGGAADVQRLLPVLLAELGLQLDPSTGRYTAAPDAALGQGAEILRALQERALRLARGEAEADPFLERQLAQERRLLDERLLRQLGPGGETSSPGLELLSRFGTDVAATRAQNARQALGVFEGLSLARQAAQDAALANRLSRFSLVPSLQFQAAGALAPSLARRAQTRLSTFQAEQAARTPGFLDQFTSAFATSAGKRLSGALFGPELAPSDRGSLIPRSGSVYDVFGG